MTTVEIDVSLVTAEFDASPTTVELTVDAPVVDLDVQPPDSYELDVQPPALAQLDISTVDATVNIAAPPVVNLTVGGFIVTGGASQDTCYVPPVGGTNQVLAKKSNLDFDLKWSGGGNRTYYTPTDTLPDPADLQVGDLWVDGENNNATWRWDGTQWVDVRDLNIDEIAGGMESNTDAINLINQALDELQIHVDDVEKTSNTVDGRVTFSDYIPTPDDVDFPVISVDPDTGENVVTYVPRIEGSVWFQRTRPRQNLLVNPSMEKNAAGWQAANCTFIRIDPPNDVVDVAGQYCLEVTSSATGNAYVEPSYSFSADEAMWYTGSAHMMLVSGSGVGCFATLAFYDAADVMLLSVTGEVEDLQLASPDVVNWNRINVVAQAPIGTSYVLFALHNPNPSDVWYMGEAIFENLDELGKYFDGDSYDGYWEGGTGDPITNPSENPKEGEQGWQESTSRLYGNKIIGVWELHSDTWIRKFFTEDTLDQIDARKINNLEEFRLADNTVAIDKLVVPVVISAEPLTKGSIVNVYSSSGIARVRLASSTASQGAAGFVLDDVDINTPVRVYSFGANPYQSDMLPGPKWLGDAGRVQDTPPSAVGALVQRVGYAIEPNLLDFHALAPIRIT